MVSPLHRFLPFGRSACHSIFPAERLIVQANSLSQLRVAPAYLVAVDRHEQHILLAHQNHLAFGSGDGGVDQGAVQQDRVRLQDWHNDGVVL